MTTNQKGRKLFLTTNSDWVRYRDGKWIESRKRIYLYWFKFLRYAEESKEFKVNWKKYEKWGGKDVVMASKFDAWWEEHWEECFGCENRNEKPLYPLSKNHRADNLRYSLLCYENRNRGTNWEIACYIQKQELQNRISVPLFEYASLDLETKGNMKWGITRKRVYDEESRSNYKIVSEYRDVEEYDYEAFANREEKRMVQGYVSRYLKEAKNYLKSVSIGEF